MTASSCLEYVSTIPSLRVKHIKTYSSSRSQSSLNLVNSISNLILTRAMYPPVEVVISDFRSLGNVTIDMPLTKQQLQTSV